MGLAWVRGWGCLAGLTLLPFWLTLLPSRKARVPWGCGRGAAVSLEWQQSTGGQRGVWVHKSSRQGCGAAPLGMGPGSQKDQAPVLGEGYGKAGRGCILSGRCTVGGGKVVERSLPPSRVTFGRSRP